MYVGSYPRPTHTRYNARVIRNKLRNYIAELYTTWIAQFVRALDDPGGGGFKSPPPPLRFFYSHTFNFGAALLCVGDFSPKNSLTSCGKKKFLMGGHDLAVRGVSKYKVDMIFIIFREFNTMLEIVDS